MGKKIKNKIQDFSARIMQEIKKENVSRYSRWYFLTRSALWVLATLFVFTLAIYLLSLIIFIFDGNAMLGLAFFGPQGLVLMMHSIPWVLILCVVALFALLEFLSTRFSFVYKRPLVYSLLASLVVLIALSTLFARSTMHHSAYLRSLEGKLPIAGSLYRGSLRQSSDVHIGVVGSIKDNVIILKTRGGETLLVQITDSTKQPSKSLIKEGSMVMVMGSVEDGKIEALGIRAAKGNKILMPRHLKMHEGKQMGERVK